MSADTGGGGVGAESGPRIDKWLWCVRVFRSRGLATEACRSGHVSINGLAVKPSRELRPGEVIIVKIGVLVRTLSVIAMPPARVGAPLVRRYMEDRTPPEAWERARAATPVERVLARPSGAGRPTKRDRRRLDTLFER